MSVVANPMAQLYRRLRAVGLKKSYLKANILPEWWDDAIAENPSGLAEGLMFLSRHLGLDLATLRDSNAPVVFRNLGVCKFKMSQNVAQEELALARSMAGRAAQLADAATTDPVLPLPKRGELIRQEILGQGAKWVDFSNLLDYCWSVGIPVIHIASFPEAKRPHGLAAKVKGRPVVVLFKKDRLSAWLLFILAHELAHICLGHVAEDGMLIDENVEKNERDSEEDEANDFAIELLTGNTRQNFSTTGRWPKADKLARIALEMGLQLHIDPGHIIVNYAHTMGNLWPVANAALKRVSPDEDALKLIQEKMADHLDWESLPEESCEFLIRVSQG